MNKDEIRKILKEIKGESFEEENNLITNGYINSFELIKLISELERQYEIRIPIEKITPDTFNSIERILNLVEMVSKE